MKRPFLIIFLILIIIIVGGLYLDISMPPFFYEEIYGEILEQNKCANRKMSNIGIVNIEIIGVITEVLNQTEYYNKYVLSIEKITKEGQEVKELINTKVLINLKKEKSYKIQLEYGEKIKVNGSVELAEGQRNFGGYNYRQFLKTKAIYAVVECNPSEIEIVEKNEISLISYYINKVHSKIEKNLDYILSEDNKGLSLGILVGNTKYINENIKTIFSESNLSHMLAISGAHVSYIILAVSKCLKKVDKKIGKIILIVLIIFFIIFTGSTPSVMRAGIMSILLITANIFHRKSDVLNNITISAFIILVINPYNIYNLGFQLSYAGTLGIILFYDIFLQFFEKLLSYIKTVICYFSTFLNLSVYNTKIYLYFELLQSCQITKKITDYFKTTIIVSVSANVLIIPIMMYYYNSVSLIFLISNLLTAPLFGIIMILGFSIIIISFISIDIAKFLSPILEIVLTTLKFFAEISSKISILTIKISTPSGITVVLIYLLIFIFRYTYVAPERKYKNKCKKIIKWIFIIYISITMIPILATKIDKNMKIYFVDVGQGDCTVIVTENNKKILIDGGGSEADYDVGKKILEPYLLDRKILKLDYVMISHFDSDHCKGVFYILQEFEVKNVIISQYGQESENYNIFLQLVKDKNINVIFVQMGMNIKIESNTFLQILWTGSSEIGDNVINNSSIVARLVYNQVSMLFTGDIEAIAEEKIANLYGNSNIKSNILKVAHHGSKSSSTEMFLKLVSPEIAMIGVGKKNNFGHPNTGVIDRIKCNGSKIYRTDFNGEIKILISQNGKIQVKTKFNN